MSEAMTPEELQEVANLQKIATGIRPNKIRVLEGGVAHERLLRDGVGPFSPVPGLPGQVQAEVRL